MHGIMAVENCPQVRLRVCGLSRRQIMKILNNIAPLCGAQQKKRGKRMKHWKNIAWVLLPVYVLVTGCIRENYDDCDNVVIYFEYLADGDKDVLYQYMDKIDLYVFDEYGKILGQRTYNQDQLSSFSAIPSFKLPPGRQYTVVALGNAYDNTEVINIEANSLDEIFFQSPSWGKGNDIAGHDDNYIGGKQFSIPDGKFKLYRDTVRLYSAHINASVEITGLPSPSSASAAVIQADYAMPPAVRIENSNARTSFTNKIDLDSKGTHSPGLDYDSENIKYVSGEFTLFRMDNNGTMDQDYCAHELVLTDSNGQELTRFNLHDFIKANEKYIDITKQEAFLPIEINFASMGVTIRVPSWYVEDIEGGWQD